MLILKKFEYRSLERIDTPAGRKYVIGGDEKPLPSVTTILSKTKDMIYIQEWINRVGPAEAERIKIEASSLGSDMHKNLERYILGEELSGTLMARGLAKVIIREGLSKVSEIWGSEVALYVSGLYAGTTDLVARMINNKTAIIDFKNSIKEKEKEWIEDYFIQGCAYKLAHDEMYGTDIDQIVLMIATRDAKYQEFVIEGKEIEDYTSKWLGRLEQYYKLPENLQ